jgi:hypothetical protein
MGKHFIDPKSSEILSKFFLKQGDRWSDWPAVSNKIPQYLKTTLIKVHFILSQHKPSN